MSAKTVAACYVPEMLAKEGHGCHTFSNSDAGIGWMEINCFDCQHYEHEGTAGEFCTMEAAMMLGLVSPQMMHHFGWEESPRYRHSYHAPKRCPHFTERGTESEQAIRRMETRCSETLELFPETR